MTQAIDSLLDNNHHKRGLTLTVATFNIHKGFSPLNRHLRLYELRQQLAQFSPDLVFLQEVQGRHERNEKKIANWPDVPQYEFLAGNEWDSVYGNNMNYANGHHGNAILSRYPIIHSHNQNVTQFKFEKRGLLHSRILLPDSRQLHCVCVHLSLFSGSRKKQMQALCAYLQALPDFSSTPIIIAGDFNDWRNHARDHLVKTLKLDEVFVSQYGHNARSFPSLFPVLRLDRIYVRGLAVDGASILNQPSWAKLSDHAALTARLRL